MIKSTPTVHSQIIMSSLSPSEESNPYLARRNAKIAQNEARLKELGLLRPRTQSIPRTATRVVSPSTPTEKTHNKAPALPVRRSKRQRTLVSSYREETVRDLQKSRRVIAEQDTAFELDPIQEQKEEDTLQQPTHFTKPAKRKTAAPRSSTPSLGLPNSARRVTLNLSQLLFGNTNTNDENKHKGLLGKQLSQTGKAFVMEESARLEANPHFLFPSVSFNKYSGVQEWGSDLCYLWVNLNAPNADVVNDFPHEGRQITWYGGSKMTPNTPVIQKLIRVGQAARTRPDSAHTGIVLWCRQYMADRKTYTPYTCLGRLSYESHDPTSRPLAFVWNLLDYDRLSNHPDPHVRETVSAMISP